MNIKLNLFPFFQVTRFAAIATLLGLTFVLSSARAELIFADSFAYRAGHLDGDGPPPGSPPGQTGWSISQGNPKVAPPGLEFPGILTAGKTANVRTPLAGDGDKAVAHLSPVTAEDGIVWIAFLTRMARSRPYPSGYAIVSLGNDLCSPAIGLLSQWGLYGIDNNTGLPEDVSYTRDLAGTGAVWIVTKLDFSARQEYVWIDPFPEAEPNVDAADAHLGMTDEFYRRGFSEIQLKGGWDHMLVQFDELRVGTTFADVVNPFVPRSQ
jgi:hypothetical protein